MNWKRLKNLKCPKCTSAKLLERSENKDGTAGGYYTCANKKCVFVIGDEAFDRVVGKIYKDPLTTKGWSAEYNEVVPNTDFSIR